MEPDSTDPPNWRHLARERALSLLYESEMKQEAPETVLASLPAPPQPFAATLVAGVGRNAARIDELISTHAEGWALERMPAVDRNILRLAVFELLECPETPVAVVIDEAVELAKAYSTEDSPRYVNGVLAAVAARLASAPAG